MTAGAARFGDASERGGANERGETLIELLVSVVVMGISVLTLLGGIGTGLRMSDIHRKQANASAYVRDFAEAVESTVAASPTGYMDCADTADYAPAFSIVDPDYLAQVVAVRYWDGSTFTNTCVLGADNGVQRVSLSVGSTDGFAAETLDVIIRRPCRQVIDFPLDPPCT